MPNLSLVWVSAPCSRAPSCQLLIAAPTINEVAISVPLGVFGWKLAGMSIAPGLVVAIMAGFIIS